MSIPPEHTSTTNKDIATSPVEDSEENTVEESQGEVKEEVEEVTNNKEMETYESELLNNIEEDLT
eukprot:1256530-Ditylum_brightwellii.AAC.1